jgi:hypothetical protein
MSLDVYLEAGPEGDVPCEKCGAVGEDRLFSRNITHNLGQMASAAGLYTLMWRPEEVGITKAEQLIKPLSEGLACLVAEPEKFQKFNPENGWGHYDGLVEFVKAYLGACQRYPHAKVRVWR